MDDWHLISGMGQVYMFTFVASDFDDAWVLLHVTSIHFNLF